MLIILAVIFVIGNNKKISSENEIGTNTVEVNNNQNFDEKEVSRIVMVSGKLYYDTGKTSNSLRCGMMDGKITSNIENTKIPTIDNQSNFEGEYDYQYGRGNTLEIYINDKWCIFEAKENMEKEQHSFYGKIIESNERNIIVEPNQEEDIRKSADKISISLEENNDTIYKVGTNVKITYTGYIMETYPAKVEATKIELKSAETFEIRFYDKHPQSDTKTHKILDKSETEKYDYNVYTYDGQTNILINGEEISLRDALLNNKITIDEIIEKANYDMEAKRISGGMYRDGGSMIYKYDNYTIIKCHTIDGNRDVYIGTKEMTIKDII